MHPDGDAFGTQEGGEHVRLCLIADNRKRFVVVGVRRTVPLAHGCILAQPKSCIGS